MRILTLLVTSLFITSTFAFEKESREAIVITTKNGDKITMGPVADRKINVANKGESWIAAIEKPRPALLNGKEIFYYKMNPDWGIIVRHTEAFKKTYEDYKKIDDEIDAALADIRAILPRGNYKFEAKDLVVNEAGQIVYYDSKGITKYEYGANVFSAHITLDMNEAQAEQINNIIIAILEQSSVTPFKIDGAVTPYLSSFTYYLHI